MGGGGGLGWVGIVSTASIDVVLKCWAPLPAQLTLQGVAGFPALDSGLQDTTDPGRPGCSESSYSPVLYSSR